MSDDAYIAQWPDGTWCSWDDLEEHLKFMSDDFEKRRILECDGEYEPVRTERVPNL